MLITVFWEDQRGSQPKSFGPHALLLACIADEMETDRWSLGKRVVAVPKKGDSKLRAALERDAVGASHSGPVVFVFDDDHVREVLGLSRGACKRKVLETAAAHCEQPIEIVLLENNVEDLLTACLEAMGKPAPASKPNPNDRDAVFQSIAAEDRSARERVRAVVPSFDRLVRYVRACLQAA